MGVFQAIRQFSVYRRQRAYAKMMSGAAPVFNSFGNDIYVSDIVNNAIRCIATEMSKLNPRHIRTDPKTGLQSDVSSDINRLLKYGPNPLMTTTDFLNKIVYLREKNKNVYIYPAWEKVPLGNDTYKRKYTGFYPLNPSNVEFLEDDNGELWIRFIFLNGYQYEMPYKDIIHWRKDYTENEFCGGDVQGQADNQAELKLLQTDDVIIQGLDKGIKTSLGFRGVIKGTTVLDDEVQQENRDKFEEKLNSSKSGLLFMDLKSEFIPITLDPKFVDKETVEFIQKRILANYSVSLPIFNGTFTEEEYQAFYEKALEHLTISLGRAFSRTLFTDRELELGNEIIFYNQGLMFTSTANKIKAVDILSRIGVLKDNEILNIFGYPPFEDGNVRHISLNYINRDIADNYQLAKTKISGRESANGDKVQE